MSDMQLFQQIASSKQIKKGPIQAIHPIPTSPDAYMDMIEKMQTQGISPLSNAPINFSYNMQSGTNVGIP